MYLSECHIVNLCKFLFGFVGIGYRLDVAKNTQSPISCSHAISKKDFTQKKKNPNHRQPVVITTVVFIYFSRWDCMLMKNENKFTIFQATFVIIPGATENIAHWFCLFLIWNGRPFLFVCLFTRYTLVYSHPTTHSINSIILYHVETLSSIDVIIIAFNYSFRISAD